MPNTFKGVVVAVAGKFEDGDKFPGWLRYHGGELIKKVDSSVTHLIASEDAYRKNIEAVQLAKELGTVSIIHSDWLYESLQEKNRRPRPVVSYLWENLLQLEIRPRKRQRQAQSPVTPSKTTKTPKTPKTPKRNKMLKDPFVKKRPTKGQKPALPTTNKPYVDEESKETWDVSLHRTRENGKSEKLRLAIFQSSKEPYTYATFVKYTRVGKSNISRIAPAKCTLAVAQKAFKDFFALQAGLQWDKKMECAMVSPKKDSEGNALPPHEGWYHMQSGRSILSAYMNEPMSSSSIPDDASTVEQPTFSGAQFDPGDSMPFEDESGFDGDIDTTDHSDLRNETQIERNDLKSPSSQGAVTDVTEAHADEGSLVVNKDASFQQLSIE
ncbi:uncharacterized protein N7483_003613 [Penicillium malachiteum]|uniref:uncharacterized protein n=1 Tax=Penicillium malachiteum TaxID=1324776 RepID=UPI0025489CA2|nr:uncharacterized protein N7483_003613 [Penicillium malachiteum]KAJ5729105.1 hypothetical protein N7483_003613 [Penicillium malachiteum]